MKLKLANLVGAVGYWFLQLSWKLAGKPEHTIEGFTYYATPGFLEASHGDS